MQKIYSSIVLLGVLFIWIPAANGQNYIETETIQKVFSYEKGTSVEVVNKYGTIHVVTWEKDSVQMDIDLYISSSSPDKLQKTRQGIDFQFTDTKYFIVATTLFVNKYGNVINDLVNMFTSSNAVEINYTLYVPKGANVKIDNKYGNVFLDDFYGELDVILAHGDLKANTIVGASELYISFCDATINNVNDLNISSVSSNIEIKKAEKINLTSKSSNINFEDVNELKMNSRNDKTILKSVNKLHGNAYFTSVHIDSLKKDMNLRLKYGDLLIDMVSKDFTFINFTTDYADASFIFEKGTGYNIDATHGNDVVLSIPHSIAKLNTNIINADDGQTMTYGYVGVAGKTAKVNINAPKKCSINISHR